MTGKKQTSLASTERLPEGAILNSPVRPGSSHDEATNIVLYTRDGVQVAPLSEGRSIVVGRFPPADVPVRDPSLSRQHACFERRDGEVWVEDLDSTNGTWVNGNRVDRCKLEPNDSVSMGTVLASVLTMEPGERHRFGALSHDCFARELSMELSRAASFRRTVTVAMVRRCEPTSSLLWATELRDRLRSFDRLGLYSRDTLEVLLPEVAADNADQHVRTWLHDIPALAVATATFPDHARSADELIGVATDTLRRGSRPGVTSPAASAGVRPAQEESPKGMVIASPKTRKLHEMAQRLASSSIPVLLLGETGVGKEVFARAIHDHGVRKDRPMVCVNCGSIPPQLVESTLFGHSRGAFTGANQQAKGVFEAAHGGTVLLDEIGELPLSAQAALLRVLETKRFCRVGAQTEIEVDVRIIAATHRDLEAMVTGGHFRRDLLFRLNAMTMHIPPLRERPEEIEPLSNRFLDTANHANGRSIRRISPDVLDVLRHYSWPGNVRELRNAIERAVVIAHGEELSIDDLPEGLREFGNASLQGVPDVSPGEPAATAINLRSELQRHETALILRALEATGWQRKEAAELLGLPLRTLAHRMKLLGIRRLGYGKDDDH